MPDKTVALAGLGAIGAVIARGLATGLPGLKLVAVSERDEARAKAVVSTLPFRPEIVTLKELCAADIVVEAMPAVAFDEIAGLVVDAGKIFVPCSVGALLSRQSLFDRAQATGARIVVPTGAIGGLDAVRALARGRIEDVTLESRKPPKGLAGVPYLIERGIDVSKATAPLLVFEGNARDACRHFPANANVAAALALAGIGAERTRVKIWADPTVERNIHSIAVNSADARLTVIVENIPSEDNPRTSKLAPLSILACLASLVAPVRVGS